MCAALVTKQETVAYLEDNEITKDQLIEHKKKAHRNYVKRQITYFKGIKKSKWIDIYNNFHQT